MTDSLKHLAGCVIFNDNREVLLLHRNTPEVVQLEIPGGEVELGEERADAAIREIWEELGVEVKLRRKIGSAPFTQGGVKYRYHWYGATIETGEPRVMEPDKHDYLGYYALNSSINPEEFSINVINLAKYLKRQKQK